MYSYTGYGVAGGDSSNCVNWSYGSSLVDRMYDGVIALTQNVIGLTNLNRYDLPVL
jgi:hypothetical protein